ncbi:MAG TPA: hypothetical protein VKK79_15945 [Candidatus Lokiarchaeia archaeon]|nr:hypothetical protein [Candidatus Lokiarchaeia archaeon]
MSKNNQDLFYAIREQVLQDIRPTPDEIDGIQSIAATLQESIEKYASAAGVPINFFEIEGSTGLKQTQLRNASDIDAFVGLPLEYVLPGGRQDRKINHKELRQMFAQMVSTWLTAAAEDAGATNVDLSYSEHPYLTAKMGHYDVDVVLCVDLPEEELLQYGPVTAVDRSPWHSRYLASALNDDQRDDVRLLKQFCKACHAYGDTSAPGQAGFIGYASELLVAHFGSFWDVIEVFSDLPQTPVDPFGREITQLRKNSRLQGDFLLVIDPTDRNRNVAASISPRAFRWVNARIQEFFAAPSADFFQIHPVPEVVDTPSEYRVIEFQATGRRHYTILRDKLYSWANSTQKLAAQELTHEPRFEGANFELFFKPDVGEYALAFWTSTPEISAEYLRQGPAVLDDAAVGNQFKGPPNVQKFLNKHPDAFIKEGFYWINQARDFTDFTTFLVHQLDERPIDDALQVINLPHLTPTTVTGRQSIYVLREMVLPYEPS